MKIVHIADVHLGAAQTKLALQLRRTLKTENASRLRQAFDYAQQIDAKAIIIAGDLFHSKNPSASLTKFFLDSVQSVAIPVFYLKGNHDQDFLFNDGTPSNFHILSQTVAFDGVNIFGYTRGAAVPIFPQEDFNIVVAHGDIHTAGNDYIDLATFKNKNINYLALGHLHNFEQQKLDKTGVAAYPGCLTSQGFDECGDKGFIVLDTEQNKLQQITLPGRKYAIKQVDITGFDGFDDLCKRVERGVADCQPQDIVRVVLVGTFDQDKFVPMLADRFSKRFEHFELVDNSKIKVDLKQLTAEQFSFKAEFVRLASQDESLSDEQRSKVIEYGINALRGDEL